MDSNADAAVAGADVNLMDLTTASLIAASPPLLYHQIPSEFEFV